MKVRKNNDSSMSLRLEDGADIYIIANALNKKISALILLEDYLLDKYQPHEYKESSFLQIKELIKVLECLLSSLKFPGDIDINKLKSEFEQVLAKVGEGNKKKNLT